MAKTSGAQISTKTNKGRRHFSQWPLVIIVVLLVSIASLANNWSEITESFDGVSTSSGVDNLSPQDGSIISGRWIFLPGTGGENPEEIVDFFRGTIEAINEYRITIIIMDSNGMDRMVCDITDWKELRSEGVCNDSRTGVRGEMFLSQRPGTPQNLRNFDGYYVDHFGPRTVDIWVEKNP